MRKKIIILIIFFLYFVLFLTHLAYGEKILYLHFTICKNDTIILDEIKILENYEVPIILRGDYRLIIRDSSRIFYNISFNIIFYFLSEPPIEIDCSPITFSFSTEKILAKEIVEVEIYRVDKLLFSRSFSLCDYDPDCKKDAAPITKCLNIKDGICEEKCPEDPDCQLLEEDKFPIGIIVLLFFIISIVVILIFLYMSRKAQFNLIKKEIKKHYD